MSGNEKNVPKRRFREFENDDDWEQRKLSELCIKFTDGDWIEAKDQSNEGVRLIQTGNVGVTRYLDKSSNQKWIAEDTFERLHCEEIFPGDILISRLPEPAGRACIMPNLGKKMITAVDCTIVRTKPEVTNKYLVQYLSTEDYFNEVNTCLAGGTRQRISRSNLSEFIVPIPKDDKEQKKIGHLFESLDNLITLHQHKLEKIKALKKAYLMEMFPAEGERTPKLRFAGFTEEWEQCKLGDLGSVVMNRRIFKEQTSDEGDVPFYKIGTFGREPDAFISRELFEEYKSKYPYPEKGDILISASGSIGKIVEYMGKDEYFQDSNIVWLQHDDQVINSFLKQFYSIVKWSGLEGSTIKRLYNKNILDTPISLPKVEEQKRIGHFFNHLDNLIILHQQKLEKLQNIKKAYLNEMFI